MYKSSSKQNLSLGSLALSKNRQIFLNKLKLRSNKHCCDHSIPSLRIRQLKIEYSQRVDKYLLDLHKWRKQSKQAKLQGTYDENCRIFISLRKQKSQYRLKMLEKKKSSCHKLAPLTERNSNHGKQPYFPKVAPQLKSGEIKADECSG